MCDRMSEAIAAAAMGAEVKDQRVETGANGSMGKPEGSEQEPDINGFCDPV